MTIRKSGHRSAAIIASIGLLVSGGALTSQALAAPALPAAIIDASNAECAGANELRVFNFTDFHGRIHDADRLFTPVMQARAENPDNVILLSSGDNIGGSIFDSFITKDEPVIKILNEVGLDAHALGNHEFDYGLDYLRDNVLPKITKNGKQVPALAANVKTNDPQLNSMISPYTYFERNGVKVAIVGATVNGVETKSAAKGMSSTDPWAEVEKQTKFVTSGQNDLDNDGTPDKANFVIVVVHDAVFEGFVPASIINNPEIDLIFGGDTHALVNREEGGKPILQSLEYAKIMTEIKVNVSAEGNICGAPVIDQIPVTAKNDAGPLHPADSSFPEIAAIQSYVSQAKAAADQKGSRPLTKNGDADGPKVVATADITRGSKPGGEVKPGSDRGVESAATNLVAQFMFDMLSEGNPEFIGIQNAGGTRDDITAGEITYKEAAAVLPFANMLKTADITGAQFKSVLEDQWQPEGKERPVLTMGLSKNISYTYDETRPKGDRITSITINGKPIDLQKTYRIGAGNFLIDSGKTTAPDNFEAFKHVTNVKDTGRVDLEAFVEWIQKQDSLTPDFSRRGVSIQNFPSVLTVGKKTTFAVGKPAAGGVALDTLNMTSVGAPQASALTGVLHYVDQAGAPQKIVFKGTAPVVDGVAEMFVHVDNIAAMPESFTATLVLTEASTGTVIQFEVTIQGNDGSVDQKLPGTSLKLPKTGV